MKRITRVLAAPAAVVWTLAAVVASASALASPASAATAQSLADVELGDVTVVVAPSDVSIDLGTTVDIEITLTNSGSLPVTDLVAHIDITALDSDSSVDPEDWTSTLSRSVGPLEPGQRTHLVWTLQPIAPGEFTLYAVGLAPGASDVSSSNVLTVSVADRRSLNPNGILPVSVALPTIVGALLVAQQRRGRRA